MSKSKMKVVQDLENTSNPAVAQQIKPIRNRVLGGDITNTSLEELGKAFDKFVSELNEKKYPVNLNSDEIEWINMNFIQSLKWKGQNVFDIVALTEGVSSLISDTDVNLEREKIKAIFHFIANGEYEGVSEIHIIKDVLTKLSKTVQLIGTDEQELRDASFEYQAAEQGIVPEQMVNGN